MGCAGCDSSGFGHKEHYHIETQVSATLWKLWMGGECLASLERGTVPFPYHYQLPFPHRFSMSPLSNLSHTSWDLYSRRLESLSPMAPSFTSFDMEAGSV